jgi:hypothetical protein
MGQFSGGKTHAARVSFQRKSTPHSGAPFGIINAFFYPQNRGSIEELRY